MAHFEPLPLGARVAAQVGIIFAILAGTLFIIIVVLGAGGSERVVAVFTPVAVVVTALGLVAAIFATVNRRTRSLGITSLFILVPCVVLSALTVLAMLSR